MPLINSSGIDTDPVGFLDSGVGGLPYLALAEKKLPDEHFVYIADTENFPYGEKTPDSIRKIVVNAMNRICKKVHPKCMVIACNTASVVALSALRKQFDIPFIGVVPAVKPAAISSEKKKIGVLATTRTVNDDYLHHLIADYADGCDVSVIPAGDIRDIVEERFFSASSEEKKKLVRKVVSQLTEAGVDSVVLGCTHFLHLEKEFKEVLGSDISIIDSREGVINQLIRILQNNRIAAATKSGENRIYITGKKETADRYILFSRAYGLVFSGVI